MFASMNTGNQFAANELNQNRLANPYTSPFIKPSILANPQIQHQSYNTIVNPESPLQSSPNAFRQQLPTAAQSQQFPTQNHYFVPSNGEPWQCPEWMATSNMQMGSYMNFIGQQQTRTPFKRKATPDMEPEIRSKQLITDEKMAAHLNGLHISSNYTAHETSSMMDALNEINKTNSKDRESMSPYPCSLQEIEEKLKRAQRITISDVVSKIKNEPLLPAAIMERMEKPCKALVVWRPPQRLVDLISPRPTEKTDEKTGEKSDPLTEESFDDTFEIEFESNDFEMDLDL